MSTVSREKFDHIEEHRDDLRSALLILELIDEEEIPGTPRLANLIELGKLALGSKLELLDDLLSRQQGGSQ